MKNRIFFRMLNELYYQTILSVEEPNNKNKSVIQLSSNIKTLFFDMLKEL